MSSDMHTSRLDQFSLLAPAKVNLFLHITGRRENGFHELESLFVRTSFGDQVTVEAADRLSLHITGPFSDVLSQYPCDSNLVMKAAKCMLAYHDKKAGAKITLEKNLPLASGIGGGSADAAATLLALMELWQVDISSTDLHAMALELGADVPACLGNHPQIVKGIGEICQSVSLGFNAAILLVNPCVSVSTPDVFKAYKAAEIPFSPKLDEKTDIVSTIHLLEKSTRNDLFKPACSLSPVIDEVIKVMHDLPHQKMVRMSGSGATCFALFNSLAEAEKASEILLEKKPRWWVAPCYIIG